MSDDHAQKFINEWAIKNNGMPFVNAKVKNEQGEEYTAGFYDIKFTEELLKKFNSQARWIESVEKFGTDTKKRLEELEDALSNDVGSSDPYWYKLSNVDNKIIIAAIENSRARRGK